MRYGLAIICIFFVAADPALSQSSGAYLAGATDRSSYEQWFAGLQGEFKTGVEFWVTHRSLPKEATCYNSNMPPESEWMHGCLTAQQRFTPLDARRKMEPEYRLGWNSIQSPELQQAIRARQSQTSGSVAPPPAQLVTIPTVPSRDEFAAVCSQETSQAYQRGQIPSPSYAYQVQENCIAKHMQQVAQAAQDAREANLRAQAARDQAVEAARQREAEAATLRAQLTAEQSPDNNCRKPTFAGGLIDTFNDFDTFKRLGLKSVDIEHLTTVSWNTETMDVVCHGTFVLNNGGRISGTLEMKPNVAGSMISQWRRD